MSVELRPDGTRKSKYGLSLLDEVLSDGVDFHMENLDTGSFWFVLRKGDDEWHFNLSIKGGSEIQLICIDKPDREAGA